MLQLSLWRETLSIDEMLQQLFNEGMDVNPVIEKLGKIFLIKKCLQEFRIQRPNDEQQLLNNFKKSMKLSNEEAFQKWLTRKELSSEKLIEQLVKREQIEHLKKTVITDEMVKEVFLKRKVERDQIMFSLIRINEKEEAQRVYEELQKEESDFATLAKKHSVGPEASRGGSVEPKNLLQINPGLRKVLSKLQEGEVSKPFTLDDKQYLIIKLVQVVQETLNLQGIHLLREKLFDDWLSRQLKLANMKVILPPLKAVIHD